MSKLTSINPVNGEILGAVKIATKADIEEAVRKAKIGFEKWRGEALEKRGKILLKAAELIKKNAKILAKQISLEMGKPLTEAEDEVNGGINDVKNAVKFGLKVLADEVLVPKTSWLKYDPVGVVTLIKPWNYPLDTPMMALAPALMAGNSVILKPSEYVPLVTDMWVKLLWQAGVPADVLQVLHGRALVGQMLVDSPIDMVSFTGSTVVGQEIANKCSARLIKFVLEMGGSSPAIVCADADLEKTAEKIVHGRFDNCGQICCAIKRVFVEKKVYNKLIKLLSEKIKKLELQPLVSEVQLKKFEQQITRGIIQGGRIIVGGRRLRDEKHIKGYFHEPTLMIHVNNKMEIMRQETFGPVLPVMEVESFDQAIKLANDSDYGLTATVFTKAKEKIAKAQKELVAGSVYINTTFACPVGSPWTGLKKSGFGTEGGKHGIWEFVHKKHWYVER
ncbi:MAG: aldehyde dehydrogenase family protein [Candidatus Beckwithbacteria bacterium]|nr:aldehyde dehydrogenase family protein [Candidatus Beckwithbacteria bacterium]